MSFSIKIIKEQLKFILAMSTLFFGILRLDGQISSESLVSMQLSDTWTATDDLGRKLPLNDSTGDLKSDKYVGIFYFTWLGAHGYDQHTKPLPDEGVQPKKDSDTVSPYDISKLLKENPTASMYGPVNAFHYWGEPYFGYYLSNDEWVIMKHAQLLSDAGVDVIVFDVTNGLAYLPQVGTICKVYTMLQEKGWAVPRIAFLTNSNHVKTTEKVYNNFYKKELYKNLWFSWKGKPLLMGNKDGLSEEIQGFFNFRRSWAWTKGQEWFGDGRDKWPWLDHYPQNYGWHESKDKPEQIVVSTAQHPISNIGRSFHNGKEPSPDSIQPGKGLFFAEQWKRALEVDPEFVFITGWNEWVAMRFNNGKAKNFLGHPIKNGETYFVDQYNEEYSRDIEPMKGGFKDNYYYQMVGNIRKFKGSRTLSFDKDKHKIKIDGKFEDWQTVKNIYYDQEGDIQNRDHPGWGRIKAYKNTSGRNDIMESRVAEGRNHLFFYIRISNSFPKAGYPEDLSLLLQSIGSSNPSWKGYQFLIKKNPKTNKVTVEQSTGGWNWKYLGNVKAKVFGKELELAIPKSFFNLKAGAELNFKWLDNVKPNGDIMRFYSQGDAAPNSRFNYRYKLIDR